MPSGYLTGAFHNDQTLLIRMKLFMRADPDSGMLLSIPGILSAAEISPPGQRPVQNGMHPVLPLEQQ